MEKYILHPIFFILRFALALTFLASPYIVYRAYNEMKAQHLINIKRDNMTVKDRLADMAGQMRLKQRAVKIGRIATGQEQ